MTDIKRHSLYGLKIAAWGILSAIPAISGWAFFHDKTVPLYVLFALITIALFIIGYLVSTIFCQRENISDLESRLESSMRPKVFIVTESGIVALCNRVPYVGSGNFVSFYYQNSEYDTHIFNGYIQLVNEKGYFQVLTEEAKKNAKEISERAYKNDKDVLKNIIVRPMNCEDKA